LSATQDTSALAPFRVRSFRFQWPADLAASWAYEMETIVLGWYVLVETQSVLLLTVFASLQYAGTLFSPLFGVMGNRIGNKRLLCGMRATYTMLSALMLALVLTGALTPLYVLVISGLLGLVRPSDLVMRYALIGETMPASQLLLATSVSRTTQDSARVAGALSGAALVAMLGMAPVYAVIAALYALSFLLTTGVDGVTRARSDVAQSSAWTDFREGAAFAWNTPQVLAAMWLALLVNLTAFPLTHGLLPYVAREVYQTGQAVLGYLAASFAFGALLGSLTLSRFSRRVPAARFMVVFCVAWHAALLLFSNTGTALWGCLALVLAGCTQSLGMVSMSAMLLRATSGHLRSRVMGIRMLMIYSLPIGLMLAGPLITHLGYRTMAALYCVSGMLLTIYIGWRWRAHIWRADAPANLK
jgi:MFS family permease